MQIRDLYKVMKRRWADKGYGELTPEEFITSIATMEVKGAVELNNGEVLAKERREHIVSVFQEKKEERN